MPLQATNTRTTVVGTLFSEMREVEKKLVIQTALQEDGTVSSLNEVKLLQHTVTLYLKELLFESCLIIYHEVIVSV